MLGLLQRPTGSGPKKKTEISEIALKAAYIKIGDFCVFKSKPAASEYTTGPKKKTVKSDRNHQEVDLKRKLKYQK